MGDVSIAQTQVAGVCDAAEARMLGELGVEWIGIPLRLPVNREDVTDAQAAEIVRSVAPVGCRFVLITYLQLAVEIAALAQDLGVQHVQLHGTIAVDELRALRQGFPELVVIKSLVVRPGEGPEPLLRSVEHLAEHVDAFITDTFNPSTGASGATGRRHDWSVSRRIVTASPRPVILAGGLTPANVREAILTVRPAGVDTHTGVEGADGRKDPELVRQFVSMAHRAFTELT